MMTTRREPLLSLCLSLGQYRGSKCEVGLPRLPFLTPCSVANVQGIGSGLVETADESLFMRKMGNLPPDAMVKIEQALLFSVGMA